MRSWILVFSLFALLSAELARAEALAPPAPGGACLSADVNALRAAGDGQMLYQIVFVNRCNLPRSFSWCAEHSQARVPAAVACRSQRGFGSDLRHAIQHRKEFQWQLPPGARIRFQDCADLEIPTADFNCEPQEATRR